MPFRLFCFWAAVTGQWFGDGAGSPSPRLRPWWGTVPVGGEFAVTQGKLNT